MKRVAIILLVLFLVATPLILAADNIVESSDKETIKDQSEDLFQKEAGIPAFEFSRLNFPGFYLTITWALLISLTVSTVILFVATFEILSFTSFESGWVKVAIAGAIIAVLGVTGGITAFTKMKALTFTAFQVIKLNLWWIVIVLLLLLIVIKPLMKRAKDGSRLSRAEEFGIKAGAALKGLGKMTEAVAKAGSQ